jgi:outer membrane protein OmpA-like peptidoglycan-associated protein
VVAKAEPPAPEPAPVVADCSALDDDNGKDIIKPEYYPNLDNIAKAIKNRPDYRTKITASAFHGVCSL